MIDNFQKNLNNTIFNVTKAISPDVIGIGLIIKRAQKLLDTIKIKHGGTTIPDKLIPGYKKEVDQLLLFHNKVHKLAVHTKQKLNTIDKINTTLNATATTLNIVVTTLKVIPAPAQFTPLGVIMLMSDKLNSAANIIKEIQRYSKIVGITLKILIQLFNVLLSDLDRLYTIIQEILKLLLSKSSTFSTELKLSEDESLTQYIDGSNTNYLGVYKDYVFVLRIDDDPTTFIGDIRRRFAVAMLKNRDVYYSDKSYTLNPDVLIEQLKLQIDSQTR